jgi:type I restriction enzyme S subunit
VSAYRPYPKYKDSGVEWLGDVPEGWAVIKLSFVAYLRSGESITSIDIEDTGTYPVFGGNGPRGFTECHTHDGYFVLVGRQGALCGNVHFTSGKFWASEHALVANPLRQYNTKWFGQTLRAMNLGQYSVSAAQPGLSVENVGNLRLPFPPLPEQIQIASFLDRECGKLDALQAKQERLIELLKEKRQALISHAVTRGLDPTAKLKPSGIEWLGDVPEGWRICKLKHVSPQVTVGIVVEPSKYYAETGVPALRSLNIRPRTIVEENFVFISEKSNAILAKSKLSTGDLVTVRTGQPGTTAVIPQHLHGCNCIDLIVIRKPKADCEQFLAWWFSSDSAVQQFSEGSGGAIQQHFNVAMAANLIIPRPPLAEQRAIVAHLDDKCGKIDRLIAKAERAIALLKERRSALISAAVTGKIDVRDVAAVSNRQAQSLGRHGG